MKVTIIGGGVMGEAILGAALERNVFDAASVTVCELLEHRRAQLQSEYGVAVTTDSLASMESADLVLLSVKPQDVHSVTGAIPPEALMLSIMAIFPQFVGDHDSYDRRATPDWPSAQRPRCRQ